MFNIQKLFLLYSFSYLSIECLIPDLKVQKVDRKLIEKKRQDTLDMCKMFNEENNRLDSFKIKTDVVNFVKKSKRIKRDLKTANSNLNLTEVQRVESIVDKLYDDMAEQGQKVTYRQRNMTTIKPPTPVENKTKTSPQNIPGRRFNFAPAILESALDSTPQSLVDATEDIYEIPWPKHWKHGIVPYFIDSNTYDSHLSEIIIRAFDYFEKATCIRLQRLRQKPNDLTSLQNAEWLYISNPSGIRQCVHSNERKANRGVQMVVFGYDCLSLGEIVHEVMHILGFSHEHTRPDRDQYITVLWDNIKPGYKKYFEIRTQDPLSNFPYDYASVLHYPSRAFSKNGQVTLLVESRLKVGQREGLSDNDIAKVTAIYSPECTKRNKDYLLKTCPSVVKLKKEDTINLTKTEIEDYFKDRLWPYGMINYKIKDKMEFTSEERENLNAVFRHIEKETCIEFRDISDYDIEENVNDTNDAGDGKLHMKLDQVMASDMNRTETEDYDNADTANNRVDSVNKLKLKYKKKHSDSDTNVAEDEKSTESEDNDIDLRKNDGSNTDTAKVSKKSIKSSSKSSYILGSLFKLPRNTRTKGQTRFAISGRRHAESSLTLVRSQDPGCTCPSPGRPTGEQILTINSDCFNSVNDLLHLFVHVLGLDHQHNMYDRDSYIRILWENLSPGIKEEIDNKLPPAASVGFPYDYQSVMHYPWLDIENGVTNIMYPIWNDGWAMGHWQGLSSTDVNKLNLIYYEQCALRKEESKQ